MFEVEDIVKSAGIFLVAKDKNSRFLYCNENFAAGLGLDSPSQITGKNDFRFFENPVAKMYQQGDAHVLKGGVFVNIREIQPQVGKTIKILTTKNQLKNKSGEVKGVVVSFIDITHMHFQLTEDFLEYNPKNRRYEFQIGNQEEYLTDREYSVFRYILLGQTAKQIAENLSISHRTVEDYVLRIKTKLQCDSKFHIPEVAMRLGLMQQKLLKSS
jgi:PAS domain S-box-containing protein